jgi:hypothetical protein
MTFSTGSPLPVRAPQPSLFRDGGCDQLLVRIRGLSPSAQAAWGKMNVAQMLAHCHVAFRVALGELRLRRALIGVLFGKWAKKSLLRDKPFRRHLPTDKAFIVRDARDFATERDALVAIVERLRRGGPSVLTSEPHPFFGALTTDEWDALMAKHLDHHLRQFGA